MNFPALRFKHDDGRDFPDWEERKIGDFVLSHKGGAPLKPADFVKNGNFEVIPKKAISRGGYLELDEVEPTYCSKEFFEANQGSVVDSSFLITTLRDLVPSGPSIGYIVKYISNKKYILAQGVYGIKVDENLIEDFLIQYSNTSKYRELMQTMMVGSTQVHIRNSDFFNTPFAVPILKEQTKIANFLTTIDEKITQLTQKNDLLTQYKKGVMQKIFSQELRFKDHDGKDFPEWEELSISEMFYRNTHSSKTEYIVSDGKFIIVDMGSISREAKLLSTKNTNFTNDFLTTNDLVMAKDDIGGGNIIGRVVQIPENNKYICGDHVYKLTLKQGYVSYFYYAVNSTKVNKSFRQKANGTAQIGISNKTVDEQLLPVPRFNEQTKIANFLTAIDDKITATQTQLQALKQYKQGLLQQMFV